MPRTVEQIQFTPHMPKALRVAAYARVSCGKDAMLHSLAAQVDHYSTYLRHHPGWEYVGVYADEAKTGTRDSRENFQRMLADCRKGEDQSHHYQVHIPLFPEHRDASGNGAGTEGPGYQRLF